MSGIRWMPLGPKTDCQTDTLASGDPWAALAANPAQERFLGDLKRVIAKRIVSEINKDPKEVERLRKSRQDARAGRLYPRRSAGPS